MVRFAAATLALAAVLHGSMAAGNELVLLDFWSPQCGPCLQMKGTIRSLTGANYPIREIDVTRDQQLARQFRVERIPCFVMLANGQEVERIVGATSQERIVQMFDRARMRLSLQSPDPHLGAPVTPIDAAPPAASPMPPASTPPAPVSAGPGGVAIGASVPADLPSEQQPDMAARLLNSSVRIRVEDAKGQGFGTGTIIDSRSGEALVVTCGHLFRDSQGKGQVAVELFDAGPTGVRVADSVPGQVISYDLDRDVALLSIRPNRPVQVAPVAAPGTKIARGDRASSIGCSHGEDPTLLPTRITALDRYQGPPNIEASGAPVVGRSGGGLFNEDGQLIGVCFAADQEGNEGLYAALESIHGELDRIGMQEVYAKTSPMQPHAAAPIVRGQELSPTAQAAGGAGQLVPVEPVAMGQPNVAPLEPIEQAALEEIMTRATEFEVVCIIRPKEAKGQSEIITLDSVSPAFVAELAKQKRDNSSAEPIRR